MRAMAKALVLTRLSKNVEAFAISKVSGVPIGRCDAQLHYLTLSYRVLTGLNFGGNSWNHGDRRFIAERFLNHVMKQCRVRLEFGEPIVGVSSR